ncbi:MAG: glycoside hydrolase family 5 protein [Burkholderiaceae bacterium]
MNSQPDFSRRRLLAAMAAGSGTTLLGLPRFAAAAGAPAFDVHKGVNVSDWYQMKMVSGPSDLQMADLHRSGIDFVRFPFDPFELGWQPDAPGDKILGRLDRLDKPIARLRDAGLKVLLDMHPGGPMNSWLNDHRGDIGGVLNRITRQVVRHFHSIGPSEICFELCNEPQRFMPDADDWQALQGEMIRTVRKETADHWVLAHGVTHKDTSLQSLKPYADKKVLYGFHFYYPFTFTHQGANWDNKTVTPFLRNVPYPGTHFHADQVAPKPGGDERKIRDALEKYEQEKWDINRLRKAIAPSVDWGKEYGVPVLCTEFGVLRDNTDRESILHWLSDVRRIFEENGVPWAVWDYCTPNFGITTCGPNARPLDDDMKRALGLKV